MTKIRISCTIEEDLIKKMDRIVRDGKLRSRSSLIEETLKKVLEVK